MPVIGMTTPPALKTLPKAASREIDQPALPRSPAAYARRLELNEDDVLLEEDGKVLSFEELCKRLPDLADKTFTLRVRNRSGEVREVKVEKGGFDFGDVVVAMTSADPAKNSGSNFNPYRLDKLRQDPTNPEPMGDPFDYMSRMRTLAGKPVVVEVLREGGTARLLVPPAFYRTFGAAMSMGPVVAVRDDSWAVRAEGKRTDAAETVKGIRAGDVLKGITLTYADGKTEKVWSDDPMKLPYLLAAMRRNRGVPAMVTVTVGRTEKDGHEEKAKEFTFSGPWDDEWNNQIELPVSPMSPVSLPELGIAYRVSSIVSGVKPGSAAAEAGIGEGDRIVAIRLKRETHKGDDRPGVGDLFRKLIGRPKPPAGDWGDWVDVFEKKKKDDKEVYEERWPHYFFYIQMSFPDEIQVKYKPKDAADDATKEATLKLTPEEDWPFEERGVQFTLDQRLQKADSTFEALSYGLDQTTGFIKQIYLNVARLLAGRVSTKTLGGPIEIAAQAFSAAEDPYYLILFLGLISVNLAVVNFLPIPVLDGGHMVFLIYEKLRGRPPSDRVREIATYLGLAILLCLMIFVFYLDIKRRFFGG
jgi:regulator of sigma E protease